MNRDKLIRELRKIAKKEGKPFHLDTKQGKGSHYIVTIGDKTSTVQSDINEGRAERIKKQLGVA